MNLEQLRLALSAADFVESAEMSFRKGDLVWVLGRFPAKVEATEPPDRATWYEVGRGDRYLKNNNSLR